MIRWFKKRRKLKFAILVMGGLAVLWLIFPPDLYGRIKDIRAMQAAAKIDMHEYLEKFLQEETSEDAHADDDINKKMEDIRRGREGPLADMPRNFDVNRYFEVFDRLRMDKGYVLDYVYNSTRNHAYPLLYARRENSEPLTDMAVFEEAFETTTDSVNMSNAYINRIHTDGSRQGFIQLAALQVVADQFYLYWHANYNDTKILARFPAWVSFTDDDVTVSLIIFSKWGGAARRSITMKRSFPHEIIDEHQTVIMPYNCGLRY